MAIPKTVKFSQMVMEVEFDPTKSGIYSKICGASSFSVTRELSTQESEVLDCADYDRPLVKIVEAGAYTMTLSAEGALAQKNKDIMIDWVSSGKKKKVRILHVGAKKGEIETEEGFAFLTKFDTNMDKSGSSFVTASLELTFCGETIINKKA